MSQLYNWDNMIPESLLCHPHSLIRVGSSYVFQDQDCGIIRKVSRETSNLHETEEHLETIRQLHSNNAPILTPTEDPVTQLEDGRVITTWPLIETRGNNPEDLPRLLAKLHQTELDNTENLPRWTPGSKIAGRLEKARSCGVPEGLVDKIEKEWKKLQKTIPAHSTSSVLIHCDPHTENMGVWKDTPTLIDLDDLSIGPREVDLAPGVAALRKFKNSKYENFLKNYALPYDEEYLEHLVKLRYLTMTTWLMTLWKIRPNTQKETLKRVTTWNDQDAPQWCEM